MITYKDLVRASSRLPAYPLTSPSVFHRHLSGDAKRSLSHTTTIPPVMAFRPSRKGRSTEPSQSQRRLQDEEEVQEHPTVWVQATVRSSPSSAAGSHRETEQSSSATRPLSAFAPQGERANPHALSLQCADRSTLIKTEKYPKHSLLHITNSLYSELTLYVYMDQLCIMVISVSALKTFYKNCYRFVSNNWTILPIF